MNTPLLPLAQRSLTQLRPGSPLRGCLAVVAALAATIAAQGATHIVNNASDFNKIPTTLNAGDVVILKSGVYGALNRTLSTSITDDATAQSNPVRIYAEEPGGVVVTGPSKITLRGRGIVFAGVDFGPGSGGATSYIINLDADSRHITLSNLRFFSCSDASEDDTWLLIEGFNHTVEYCSFYDKRSLNTVIAIKRHTSEAGIDVPRNHVIRRCYFGPRECSPTDNGYETIRIGDSSSQAHDMRVTIEHNVFFRSIWRSDGQKPNDMEIISNKSRGNIIRHNTLLESYGQITLRHGDACIVEGNFIFGSGYYSLDGTRILLRPANPYQTGIRVIGTDHIIRNNYLINLRSTNLRAALCLMAGEDSWSDGNGSNGNNGYEAADRAQIYNNTFIDCGEINLGFVNGPTRQPVGVQIYNNVWQSSAPGLGIVRNSAFSPAGSGGNYIFSTGNLGWNGLGGTYSSSVSPRITELVGNLLVPDSLSPLLDAAHPALSADTDIRGLARPATGRDIGAWEREVTGEGARPLLRHEVGPEFDGGPIGHYPAPGGATSATAPVITQQPQARIVTGGTSVSFSVTATGSPRPTFQWLKDGIALTDNTSAFTDTLTLPAASFDDVGHYSVLVSNLGGRVTSAPASLGVISPNEPVTVIEEKFTDGVRTNQAPPDSLAWFCSGSASKLTVSGNALVLNTDGTAGRHAAANFPLPVPVLGVGDRLTLDFDFSLGGTIRDIAGGLRFGLFDGRGAGSFADAQNPAVTHTGYALTTNLNPSSGPPAQLRKRGAVANSFLTSLASFSTLSSGGTTVPLTAGTTYHGTLTLERTSLGSLSLTATLSGGALADYTLTATDDASPVTFFDTLGFAIGSSSGAAAGTLTLDNIVLVYEPSGSTEPPAISVQPVAQTVAPGGTASFSVQATGSAPLSLQWRKDGVPIPGATQSTLTIAPASAADAGVYSVIVTNTGGSIASEAVALQVAEPGADPYLGFLAGHGLDPDGNGAPGADPDQDGLPNLLEYAFGRDPLHADTDLPSAPVLPFAATTSHSGQTWLTLAFTRDLASTGLAFTVQASDDMVAWTDIDPFGPNQVSATTEGNRQTIVVRDTAPIDGASPARFLRLRVALAGE